MEVNISGIDEMEEKMKTIMQLSMDLEKSAQDLFYMAREFGAKKVNQSPAGTGD